MAGVGVGNTGGFVVGVRVRRTKGVVVDCGLGVGLGV